MPQTTSHEEGYPELVQYNLEGHLINPLLSLYLTSGLHSYGFTTNVVSYARSC